VAAAALESRGSSVRSAAGGGHPRSARVENSQNRAELSVIILQRLMRGNLKAADLSHWWASASRTEKFESRVCATSNYEKR